MILKTDARKKIHVGIRKYKKTEFEFSKKRGFAHILFTCSSITASFYFKKSLTKIKICHYKANDHVMLASKHSFPTI